MIDTLTIECLFTHNGEKGAECGLNDSRTDEVAHGGEVEGAGGQDVRNGPERHYLRQQNCD